MQRTYFHDNAEKQNSSISSVQTTSTLFTHAKGLHLVSYKSRLGRQTYTQQAIAQHIPTRAIAIVACHTFWMKKVENMIKPKSTSPAVQIFRSMNGTVAVSLVGRFDLDILVGSLRGRPSLAASAFHRRAISLTLSSSTSSSSSESSTSESGFSLVGLSSRRSRAERYGNKVPAAIATDVSSAVILGL